MNKRASALFPSGKRRIMEKLNQLYLELAQAQEELYYLRHTDDINQTKIDSVAAYIETLNVDIRKILKEAGGQ
jgi:capsid portal protein